MVMEFLTIGGGGGVQGCDYPDVFLWPVEVRAGWEPFRASHGGLGYRFLRAGVRPRWTTARGVA
jgi:hypothetical protein